MQGGVVQSFVDLGRESGFNYKCTKKSLEILMWESKVSDLCF